jgi:hypothetical protein
VDDQTLVNLEIQGVGIAYWYLPANEPYGVNVLQDTFRNTIECLIPQHRQYHVQWTIPGKPSSSGQLQLIAEAPSKALWIATQEALKSRPRVTIYLTVLEDKPNPLSVKILMPGFNSVGWYNRLPDDQLSHQNREIFEAIRNFARPRTEPNRTPLRIWSGVENYDSREILQDPLSMVLPAEKDPGLELDIWMREYLAFTFDTVVVRPEFEEYRIICMMDHMKEDLAYENCPSKILAPWQGYVTLERFRRAVRQLLGDFNPGQEYIAIEQPQSDQTFLIGPDMTELQWRFHVFDWLDNSTIFFRRHQAMPSGECLLTPGELAETN